MDKRRIAAPGWGNKLHPAIPKEDEDQIKLCVYLQKRGLLFYAVPNGAKRNVVAAVKMKRMGLSAGVPDLCIPMARKGCHGLYIELKRLTGGSLSDAQAYWLTALKREGYLAVVAKGLDEAIKVVEDYFA